MADQHTESSPLFIGIGNSFRCDDGVGPFVAQTLAERGFDARVHAGDGTGLIDLFADFSNLVLIDATRSSAEPGTLIRLDAMAEPLPAELFHYSTHRFGLAEAVETARALGQLPKSLVVFGIEGAEFGAGTDLSAPVQKAVADLVEALIAAYGA